MDNLPNDPSNPNNNSNTPPFGSDFNPHTNPPDPNYPYSSLPQTPSSPSQPSYPSAPNSPDHPEAPNYSTSENLVHSAVASHQKRDSHGRFLSEHPTNPIPPASQVSLNTPSTQNIPNPPLSSNPYDPSQIPTVESNFKKAVKFIVKIKWVKVSYYIVSFIALVKLIIDIPAIKNLIEANFPNSSPVFAREVTYQGELKNSSTGLYSLVLPNQEVYTIRFKPSVSLTNLKKLNEVLVKGNLTWTPFVIANAEIYPLNFTIPDDSDSSKTPTSQTIPNSLNNSASPAQRGEPDSSSLPPLYSKLTWEITKTKTLIFTSGLRKIEQEGVYLESSQVTQFPQEFINYYTKELSNLGFKQTLNSQEPTGITTTFAKDDLFLTFGVKNIFKGSGDTKTISGYKAFIEHN